MYKTISIKQYSDKSFVLRGDTYKYRKKLLNLYGIYNKNLVGGPGWMFSNKHFNSVNSFINEHNKLHTIPEIIIKNKDSPKHQQLVNSLDSGIKMTDKNYIQPFRDTPSYKAKTKRSVKLFPHFTEIINNNYTSSIWVGKRYKIDWKTYKQPDIKLTKYNKKTIFILIVFSCLLAFITGAYYYDKYNTEALDKYTSKLLNTYKQSNKRLLIKSFVNETFSLAEKYYNKMHVYIQDNTPK